MKAKEKAKELVDRFKSGHVIFSVKVDTLFFQLIAKVIFKALIQVGLCGNLLLNTNQNNLH